ncbi:MAG TPA: hypothetical protein VJZ26_18085 [Blastocatellia bacterium]|nr:hypothetical protein [Blastocatellia bacterium]
MKAQRRWVVAMFALALLATSAVVVAQDKAQDKAQQEKAQKRDKDILIERNGTFNIAVPPPDGGLRMRTMAMDDAATSIFVSSEMGFGGKVVKGAPYSAQAVTESVQMLADGNRIVHKSTASVYRDGEGRTRRDVAVGNIGPYAMAGDPPQTIFINDPVANVNYILDPRSHSARKLSITNMDGLRTKIDAENRGDVHVFSVVTPEDQRAAATADMKAAAEIAAASGGPKKRTQVGKGDVLVISGDPAAAGDWPNKEPKIESLGKQMIEGVEAEGTRSTLIVPAGAIGNEQPMQIVVERWYSPELQQVVMHKHTDPRFGETSYRLTGINRGEPARSLFEVPSEYTVKETLRPDIRYKVEREIQRAKRKGNDNEQ